MVFSNDQLIDDEIRNISSALPSRINADPDNVEQGLAKLVLTIVELIRKLLEKQAMRRMDSDTLTEDQIERLGETLMLLEKKMEELKKVFNIKEEELNVDLGPLGKLL